MVTKGIKNRKVTIDPRCKFVYLTLYLQGLEEIFGRPQVSFSTQPFSALTHASARWDFDHYMAFHIWPEDVRFVIDYGDKPGFNLEALDWCDAYAKVNWNYAEHKILPENLVQKVVQIGPSFGVNNYSSSRLYSLCLRNWIKAFRLGSSVSFREFLKGYNWTRIRQPESTYKPAKSDPKFIFHVSRHYKKQSHGDYTNTARSIFVRAAKQDPEVEFRGGLVGVTPDDFEFSDVASEHSYTSREYLQLTCRSALVFNTPAAWGCHGWKLGEYLALGKAIVSTPFHNKIPPGLKHGENIHIVDDLSEMEAHIPRILRDRAYCRHLEQNARRHYEEYLAPRRIIEIILGHSGITPAIYRGD
jgi:hypothetical protein